jgi:hypothetical protein
VTVGAEGWRAGGFWFARTGVGSEMGAGECSEAASPVDGPSSRMPGSEGGGPSRAHRRDSYFDRMNDSILLRLWKLCQMIKPSRIKNMHSLIRWDVSSFEVCFPV